MKNTVYILMACAVALLSSCDKDDIGGTATEAMAGEWWVTCTCVDEDGNTVYEDDEFFGLGSFTVLTYNTADNVADKIWVDDQGNFWEFQVKCDADQSTLTFSTDGEVANNYYDCNVEITGGKIMYGNATTPSGVAADSIVFYVKFDDDPYPYYYGFDSYKISGFRYTGFDADE